MPTASELAGATAADAAEARAAVSAYLAAAFPSLSVAAGQLADLLVGPAADGLAAVEVRAAAAEASLDPEAALAGGGYDPDLLNAALAGRGVTRLTAAAAAGTAALKFSTDALRSVGSGFKFATADGVAYVTSETVRVLPTTATAVSSGDRVLAADPAGGYVATVAMRAAAAGAAGNRPAGVVLTPSGTLSGLTAAYAATDLAGGADAETDAQLLARLPAASAPRTAASFDGAAGVVRGAADFSAVAVVGYGHEGMTRGRSVLTGQTPGRADVRVRVAGPPGRVRLPVTATYTGPDGPSSGWRFAIDAGDAPGWFAVERVVKVNAVLTSGGYVPVVTPGYDLDDADPAPDVRSGADAYLSAYSTASVAFADTDTPTGGLVVDVSTKAYDAVLRVVPGVGAAQAALDADSARPAGGDALARAAAPVMVSLTAAAAPAVGVSLTAAEVAAAVAAAVNAQGISATLNGSSVGAAAAALLPAGTALQLSAWAGLVYNWDGTTDAASGSTGLVIATDWDNGIGPDAVAFYCDPASVTASVS